MIHTSSFNLQSNAMSMRLPDFRQEVQQELLRILDYWMKYAVETDKDGFYGVVNDKNIPYTTAPKSIVINSRILWTFSAVHQLFPQPQYPLIAKRAYDYIKKYFIDDKYGGVYWSVTSDGKPLQTKKQLYGHSFALYGLAEYYKIAKSEDVSQTAHTIFSTISDHAYDKKNGGYMEAFEQDWKDTNDYVLSRAPNSKSMNTHLHLLEAFTNFYRVWKTPASRFHLKHSIEMMLHHIIDPQTNRMRMFFTKEWKPSSGMISYGHDIEGSWLLAEAGDVLDDKALKKKCNDVSALMAKAAIDGLADDGAIYYEYDPVTRHLNDSKQWWPQAEAMVGFYNAYELTGKVHYLEKSQKAWDFIKKNLIDYKNGEWFGATNSKNEVTAKDKITFWKCPYHNGRACMEIWQRIAEYKVK